MRRIAILAGYDSSLHTVALVDALKDVDGVEVVACVCVKTFSLRRIKALARQHGPGQAWRRFQNIFLKRTDPQLDKERAWVVSFLDERGTPHRTLSSLCSALGIPFKRVMGINESESRSFIRGREADLILYSGGGIVRKALIETAPLGVLNAHGAILPRTRGMNGVEWSLLLGRAPGVTVHRIDPGIDTGDIMLTRELDIEPNDDIASLRGKSALAEVHSLLDAVRGLDALLENPTPQQPADGKQYFTMHPFLKELAARRLMHSGG